MKIFSTFEHNAYLEMAITLLEEQGIKKEDIFAMPLDKRREKRQVFDSIHRSDGTSLIDIGVALATAFSVIGASIGFDLAWGPIFWGLIGAAAGFMIGFMIRILTEVVLKPRRKSLKGKSSEVILIIACEENQGDMVEGILWEHYALGVGKYRE
ncbi:MAG: hypothetical protein ACQEWE_04750 [Bacillota bacterium]